MINQISTDVSLAEGNLNNPSKYRDDNSTIERRLPSALTELDEKELQLVLAHPGRRQVFDSMQTYDLEAAWRYIHFCCSPIDDAEESKKDCQLLLDVLPDREKDAIALYQIRSLLQSKDPHYNYSTVSRWLEYLVQFGKADRKVSAKPNQFGNKTYLYWKKLCPN